MANGKSAKNNKQKLNIAALVKVIGAALLIVAVIIAAAYVIDEKIPAISNDDLQTIGTAFDIDAESVNSIVPYSGGVAAIADSAVCYFDSSGNLIASNEHTFSTPIAETAGKNLLLYDLGGYGYRIEKRGGVSNKQTTSSPITCAAIGKNGDYAYSLNSDSGYQSHLFVYSRRNKKIFEWGSSSDYISVLALSDNGKCCAAGILTSEDAKIVSTVKLFAFESDEPLLSADFTGSVIYDIAFTSTKTLLVFCSDGVYSVGTDGTKVPVLSYSSNEISCFDDFQSGLKVLSIAVYGNENNRRVVVFNKSGKQLFEKNFTEDVTSVVCSKNRISVIDNNKIETFDTAGNSVGLVYLNENVSSAVLSGSDIFVLGASGLYSFSSNLRSEAAKKDIDSSAAASNNDETLDVETTVSDNETTAADNKTTVDATGEGG